MQVYSVRSSRQWSYAREVLERASQSTAFGGRHAAAERSLVGFRGAKIDQTSDTDSSNHSLFYKLYAIDAMCNFIARLISSAIDHSRYEPLLLPRRPQYFRVRARNQTIDPAEIASWLFSTAHHLGLARAHRVHGKYITRFRLLSDSFACSFSFSSGL